MWLARGVLSGRLLVGRRRGRSCRWPVDSRHVLGGFLGFDDADQVIYGLIFDAGRAQYLAAHVKVVNAQEEYVLDHLRGVVDAAAARYRCACLCGGHRMGAWEDIVAVCGEASYFCRKGLKLFAASLFRRMGRCLEDPDGYRQYGDSLDFSQEAVQIQ